jgi:hypothetical protein
VRDELAVAAKLRERDGLVIEHVQESGRASAVLDIGLPWRGTHSSARR